MTRRKEIRNPEATREALLKAGSALFSARGYDGVSVEALARAAGVNKALVSYYFGGKRGLYDTVLVSTFQTLADQLAGLAASEAPAPERLRRFVALVAELATVRRPDFPALFVREVLAAGRLQPKVLPHIMVVYRTVEGMLEQGMKDGDFRKLDPALTYMSLMGALLFFFVTAPVRRRSGVQGEFPRGLAEAPIEAYVEHVQEFLSRALARGESSHVTRRR